MKHLKLKRWVKVLITALAIASIILILTHLFLLKKNDFIKVMNSCDQKKGSLCNYYEIRYYMLKGEE